MAAAAFSFVGKVAVVTGAGGGLGRAYAIEFARRGAYVVVNDLGGTFHGEGHGQRLADQVVEEIVKAGGKAVANYNSVENGEKIIQTAIESFGKVDILVNNAGILRDRSFLKLTEQDWDKIFEVHVRGAFKVTKAAWIHMVNQKYGRIIMTTSPAGLYGNFGQANYSAAKMALVGLAKTLSIEGKKKNIFVNTIAPLAVTRMTEDIMPGLDFRPEHVAPYVVFLCHESCKETGGVFEVAGGFGCKTRWQRSKGAQLRRTVGDSPSVEDIAKSWDELTDFSLSTNPSTISEATDIIMHSLQKIPEEVVIENVLPHEKMTAFTFPESVFFYTTDNVIQYAFGIGATLPDDLHFIFDGHPSFSALPTYAAIMGQDAVFGQFMEGIPGFEEIDVSRVIHGEQYVELVKQIPTSGKVRCNTKIVDVLDKRKFCQVVIDTDIYDFETGDLLCRNQWVLLFLGVYGIGRRGKSAAQVPSLPPPNRSPDVVYEEKTSINQAAMYRLSGDKNPLHIDSDFSNAMGFGKPILHGLCTFGYGLRHVLKTFASNNATSCKAIKAQFSKPVLPGDILHTEMWLEGCRVYFQTKIKENGNTVIKGAYVDFDHNVQLTNKAQSVVLESVSELSYDGTLKAVKVFEDLKMKFSIMPHESKNLEGTILFQITKERKIAGEWILEFKESQLVFHASPSTFTPNATVTMDDDLFASISDGMLSLMQVDVKMTGEVALVERFFDLFKNRASKL